MYLTEELFETADMDHIPSKHAMDHSHHNHHHHHPPPPPSPDHLGKRKRGTTADQYTTNTM